MTELTWGIMQQAIDRAPKPLPDLILVNDETEFKNLSAVADAYNWPTTVRLETRIGKPGEVFCVTLPWLGFGVSNGPN